MEPIRPPGTDAQVQIYFCRNQQAHDRTVECHRRAVKRPAAKQTVRLTLRPIFDFADVSPDYHLMK
jgi:hypothetical protein